MRGQDGLEVVEVAARVEPGEQGVAQAVQRGRALDTVLGGRIDGRLEQRERLLEVRFSAGAPEPSEQADRIVVVLLRVWLRATLRVGGPRMQRDRLVEAPKLAGVLVQLLEARGEVVAARGLGRAALGEHAGRLLEQLPRALQRGLVAGLAEAREQGVPEVAVDAGGVLAGAGDEAARDLEARYGLFQGAGRVLELVVVQQRVAQARQRTQLAGAARRRRPRLAQHAERLVERARDGGRGRLRPQRLAEADQVPAPDDSAVLGLGQRPPAPRDRGVERVEVVVRLDDVDVRETLAVQGNRRVAPEVAQPRDGLGEQPERAVEIGAAARPARSGRSAPSRGCSRNPAGSGRHRSPWRKRG